MASLALATDLQDLRRRLGRIVVASTYDGKPVTADDLQAGGAMTVIMKDALKPNLVQTREGQPALIHAGPFGNIAHAANSILADRMALKLADYVVTEAGFASDLGFQKFCDIVCRTARITPSAAVLVTTVRATKSHGGERVQGPRQGGPRGDPRGADNLAAHVQIVAQYGLPCVVTVNGFPTDSPKEIALVRELALNAGAETVVVARRLRQGRRRRGRTREGGRRRVRQAEHVLVPDAGRHAAGRSRSRRSRRRSTARLASICRCRR